MKTLFAFFLLLILPQLAFAQEPIYNPNSSVGFAATDVSMIDLAYTPHIRYLSLYNFPKVDRHKLAVEVSFVINSLSRRRKPYIPVFVGASDETVIRINLRDYGIDPKVWDKLGANGSGSKPHADPYFHAVISQTTQLKERTVIKTRQVKTGRVYSDGTPELRTEQFEAIEKVPDSESSVALVTAPWLDPNAIATLIQATQSQFPILRADWFIVNAMLAPVYYDFLGLGNNLVDFENLVFGPSAAVRKKLQSQDKGVVVWSTVSNNNRTLTRGQILGAPNGYIWESHDALDSVGDRDYVKRVLDENFDATEDIATLPNGLQVYFLTDGKGNRLDAGNIEVVHDDLARDRVVRSAKSCVMCHATGINPIGDEIRKITELLTNQEQVKLLSTNEQDNYRVADLFGSNLDRQVVIDQQVYADAVAAATGIDMIQNAALFTFFFNLYYESLLTKEMIARDVGISLPELEFIARSSNDNLLLGIVKTPIRPVRRDQWQQSFQGIMLLVLAARNAANQQQIGPPPPSVVVPADNSKALWEQHTRKLVDDMNKRNEEQKRLAETKKPVIITVLAPKDARIAVTGEVEKQGIEDGKYVILTALLDKAAVYRVEASWTGEDAKPKSNHREFRVVPGRKYQLDLTNATPELVTVP